MQKDIKFSFLLFNFTKIVTKIFDLLTKFTITVDISGYFGVSSSMELNNGSLEIEAHPRKMFYRK
jgi:hypothetical protein